MLQTNDLGIVVTNVQECLLGCEIIKDFIVQRPHQQHIIFTTTNIDDVHTKFIPILPIVECQFFYGNVIVFGYEALKIAMECMNLDKVLLYTTDNIWKNNHTKQFKELNNIYTAEKLIVIAQNQQQYDDYYKSWNKQPYTICEDLKYEQLSEII